MTFVSFGRTVLSKSLTTPLTVYTRVLSYGSCFPLKNTDLMPISLSGSPIGSTPGKMASARLSVMMHLSGDERAVSGFPSTKSYEKTSKKVESTSIIGFPSTSLKLSFSDLMVPPWLTTQQLFSISGYV